MRERVVMANWFLFSPSVCEEIPAVRAAHDELRSVFDLTIFHWPGIKGGPDLPPTWQGAVQALSEVLTPGCHLLTAGAVGSIGMLALNSTEAPVRSWVCDGMALPPATLRALGKDTLADAVSVLFRGGRGSLQQILSLALPGGSDQEVARWAARIEQDADLDYMTAMLSSFAELNLVAEAPLLDLPTLYLESPAVLIGLDEGREIFRRFVPDVQFDSMPAWDVTDSNFGVTIAGLAGAFIQRQSRSQL